MTWLRCAATRVALAEAERILLSVAGVAQAAIKPFPTPSGDNRLVGYVMLAPGRPTYGGEHSGRNWASWRLAT